MTTSPAQSPQWSTEDDGTLVLVAQRCAVCSQLTFPPTAEVCPHCWSSELMLAQIEGSGIIFASTTVQRSFPGRAVPYTVGLVDLPAGLRVMAAIAGDPAHLDPGTRVEAIASSESRPELPATSYTFRPVA